LKILFFIDAGKRVQELVRAGAFQEGFNGLDFDPVGTRALMYSGRPRWKLMGTWQLSTIKGRKPRRSIRTIWDFSHSLPLKKERGDPKDIVGTVGDNFYEIASTCKNPDEAFALLQYMIDDTSVALRAKAGRRPTGEGI
jgi:raffinose/stachyose/melibiose transport system substrate-binding protein